MKIGDLTPAVEQHTAFELYSLERILDCAGCYCLTNAGGDILYIGQAVSVRRRLVQHFDGEKRETVTPHGRISVAWWRTEEEIRLSALERGWIEAYLLREGALPPMNRVSGPI